MPKLIYDTTLTGESIDITPEQWQEIRAKYGKTREQKIREAVEHERANVSEGHFGCCLTPKERARRIVEFAVEQLNDGWKPDWNDTDEEKHELYFNHVTNTFSICEYRTLCSLGGFILKNPKDKPLVESLCHDELETLKG